MPKRLQLCQHGGRDAAATCLLRPAARVMKRTGVCSMPPSRMSKGPTQMPKVLGMGLWSGNPPAFAPVQRHFTQLGYGHRRHGHGTVMTGSMAPSSRLVKPGKAWRALMDSNWVKAYPSPPLLAETAPAVFVFMRPVNTCQLPLPCGKACAKSGPEHQSCAVWRWREGFASDAQHPDCTVMSTACRLSTGQLFSYRNADLATMVLWWGRHSGQGGSPWVMMVWGSAAAHIARSPLVIVCAAAVKNLVSTSFACLLLETRVGLQML